MIEGMKKWLSSAYDLKMIRMKRINKIVNDY
jgi:hypothetical protein